MRTRSDDGQPAPFQRSSRRTLGTLSSPCGARSWLDEHRLPRRRPGPGWIQQDVRAQAAAACPGREPCPRRPCSSPKRVWARTSATRTWSRPWRSSRPMQLPFIVDGVPRRTSRCRGSSRTRALPSLPLPLHMHLAALSGALEGLGYAHDALGADGAPLRIVHRDVSPHNVFVTSSGMPKLLDFGFAQTSAVAEHDAEQRGPRGLHVSRAGVGPRGRCRSDLFAIGVMLWEAANADASGRKRRARPRSFARSRRESCRRLGRAHWPTSGGPAIHHHQGHGPRSVRTATTAQRPFRPTCTRVIGRRHTTDLQSAGSRAPSHRRLRDRARKAAGGHRYPAREREGLGPARASTLPLQLAEPRSRTPRPRSRRRRAAKPRRAGAAGPRPRRPPSPPAQRPERARCLRSRCPVGRQGGMAPAAARRGDRSDHPAGPDRHRSFGPCMFDPMTAGEPRRRSAEAIAPTPDTPVGSPAGRGASRERSCRAGTRRAGLGRRHSTPTVAFAQTAAPAAVENLASRSGGAGLSRPHAVVRAASPAQVPVPAWSVRQLPPLEADRLGWRSPHARHGQQNDRRLVPLTPSIPSTPTAHEINPRSTPPARDPSRRPSRSPSSPSRPPRKRQPAPASVSALERGESTLRNAGDLLRRDRLLGRSRRVPASLRACTGVAGPVQHRAVVLPGSKLCSGPRHAEAIRRRRAGAHPRGATRVVDGERADLANRVGHARITSNEAGATISIDDVEVGVTPLGEDPCRERGGAEGEGAFAREARRSKRSVRACRRDGRSSTSTSPSPPHHHRRLPRPSRSPPPNVRAISPAPGPSVNRTPAFVAFGVAIAGAAVGCGLRRPHASRQVPPRGGVHREGLRPRVPARCRRRIA